MKELLCFPLKLINHGYSLSMLPKQIMMLINRVKHRTAQTEKSRT